MININQNIPAFYINLDENIKRNKTMLGTLNKYKFKNIVRVPGINTKTIERVDEYKNIIDKKAYDKLIENNKTKQRTNHYELTNGSIGCYLSHMNIYEHIVKNNIDLFRVYIMCRKLKNITINMCLFDRKSLVFEKSKIFFGQTTNLFTLFFNF
jgi:hypothetical protein